MLWNAPLHSWSGTASEAMDFIVPLVAELPHLGLVGGCKDLDTPFVVVAGGWWRVVVGRDEWVWWVVAALCKDLDTPSPGTRI